MMRRQTIEDVIAAYRRASDAFDAAALIDDDLSDGSPEWAEYERSERAVIDFPCRTIEDIRKKVSAVLANRSGLFDTVHSCMRDGDDVLAHFLRSMLA